MADPGVRPSSPSSPPGSGDADAAVPDSKVKALNPVGLGVGGAAAATASVIGGQLGVAGTVIGAFLTSVVSAVALALYSDSVRRTKRAAEHVTARVRRTAERHRSHGAPASSADSEAGAAPADDESGGRGRRIGRIILFTLIIGVIAVVAVFGIQKATGTELSPGTGTVQRSVTGDDSVSSRTSDTPQEQQPTPTDAPSTAPGENSTSTPSESTAPTSTAPEATPSTGGAEQSPSPTSSPSGDSGNQGDSGDQGGGSGNGAQGGGSGNGAQGGGSGNGAQGGGSANQGGGSANQGGAGGQQGAGAVGSSGNAADAG